jgi:hypothetical protein
MLFNFKHFMPFTKSAVELFISAKAATVTACGASDLKAIVPEAEHGRLAWTVRFANM